MEDIDASVAHYCFQRYGIRPSEFVEMEHEEKLFIIASTQIQMEEEKKMNKEMNKSLKLRNR